MLTSQGPRAVLIEEVTVFARTDCAWKPTLCSIKKVWVSPNEERTQFAIVSFIGRVSYVFLARCNRYFGDKSVFSLFTQCESRRENSRGMDPGLTTFSYSKVGGFNKICYRKFLSEADLFLINEVLNKITFIDKTTLSMIDIPTFLLLAVIFN